MSVGVLSWREDSLKIQVFIAIQVRRCLEITSAELMSEGFCGDKMLRRDQNVRLQYHFDKVRRSPFIDLPFK